MSSGSGNASTDTSAGPVGPKLAKLLPRQNWGGTPVICTARSEMSWPSVRPATASHASATATRDVSAPITATISTSQSTISPESGTSAVGPAMQLGNFVNVSGAGGSCAPVSPAWSR